MSYKVGQIVKNKRTRLVRRITKVQKAVVHWISKDLSNKGKCSAASLTRWIAGKDL